MIDEKTELFRAIIKKEDVKDLCRIIEEDGIKKVSSITINLKIERDEDYYASASIHWSFDEEYPAQMETLWNFFSSGLCE